MSNRNFLLKGIVFPSLSRCNETLSLNEMDNLSTALSSYLSLLMNFLDDSENFPENKTSSNTIISSYSDSGRVCIESVLSKWKIDPMNHVIEVPRDSVIYNEALSTMKKALKSNDSVHGTKNTSYAERIVVRGVFTFRQVLLASKHYLRALLTSRKFKSSKSKIGVRDVITTSFSGGCSSLMVYWLERLKGEEDIDPLLLSMSTSLSIGGRRFLKNVIGNVSKTSTFQFLNPPLIILDKYSRILRLLGEKGAKILVNLLRDIESDHQHNNLLSTNSRDLTLLRKSVGSTISSYLVEWDAERILRKIDMEKDHTAKKASSVVGGVLGGYGGMAIGGFFGGTLGSIVPVAGTLAGSFLGTAIGGLMGGTMGAIKAGRVGELTSRRLTGKGALLQFFQLFVRDVLVGRTGGLDLSLLEEEEEEETEGEEDEESSKKNKNKKKSRKNKTSKEILGFRPVWRQFGEEYLMVIPHEQERLLKELEKAFHDDLEVEKLENHFKEKKKGKVKYEWKPGVEEFSKKVFEPCFRKIASERGSFEKYIIEKVLWREIKMKVKTGKESSFCCSHCKEPFLSNEKLFRSYQLNLWWCSKCYEGGKEGKRNLFDVFLMNSDREICFLISDTSSEHKRVKREKKRQDEVEKEEMEQQAMKRVRENQKEVETRLECEEYPYKEEFPLSYLNKEIHRFIEDEEVMQCLKESKFKAELFTKDSLIEFKKTCVDRSIISHVKKGKSIAKRVISSVTQKLYIELKSYFQLKYENDIYYHPEVKNDLKTIRYFGEFNEKFEPHGFGVLFKRFLYSYNPLYEHNYRLFPVYFGSFKDGQKEGKGRSFAMYKGYVTQVFQGVYAGGKKSGRGETFDPKSGLFRTGTWKEGTLDRSKSYHEFKCPDIDFLKIRKYLLKAEILGRGAFGDVYCLKTSDIRKLVTNETEEWKSLKDEFVAVKIMMTKSNYEYQIIKKMSERGIGLCSRLNCDHILSPIATISGFRKVGYVMKYCKYSVDKLIHLGRNVLDTKEKIRILYETALGVKALHDEGMMHRDLKWGNILIGNDVKQTVKITDFDTLKEDERFWKFERVSHTSNIGTKGFLAPERFLGKQYSLKSDVYSYSMMMYCLITLTNRPIWIRPTRDCSCGKPVMEIVSGGSEDYHVSSCFLRPFLSPGDRQRFPSFLVDLMEQCWKSDPEDRPSFEEIVEIFESEFYRKERCYAVVSLKFPNLHRPSDTGPDIVHELLLGKGKVSAIRDWVTRKFPGSTIAALKVVQEEEGEEEIVIEKDEDVVELLLKKRKPVVEVFFDGVSGEFDDDEQENTEPTVPSCPSSLEDLKKKIESLEKKNSELENELKELREFKERHLEKKKKGGKEGEKKE